MAFGETSCSVDHGPEIGGSARAAGKRFVPGTRVACDLPESYVNVTVEGATPLDA